MRDHFVREISARAAPVLHDDLLAPEFGQPARIRVVASAPPPAGKPTTK